MQNTMKQARNCYRRAFSHVVEEKDANGTWQRVRRWFPAPGLRNYVRNNRNMFPHAVGKLAQILAA